VSPLSLSRRVSPSQLISISSFASPSSTFAQARTPVGSFQGQLAKATAVQLGVAAVKGALAQSGVKPEQVEDLYFGQVLQGGAGQSPARQVVIGSGLPESTEATTINKVRRSFPLLSLLGS
jgi:acetyl-CoA acetyltransferase